MNGIEILAQSEVVAESAFNWIAFWILVGIMFVLSLIVGISFGTGEGSLGVCICIFLLTFILGGSFFWWFSWCMFLYSNYLRNSLQSDYLRRSINERVL